MLNLNKIIADIIVNELYLGKSIDGTDDVIENYEEVECPEQYKNNRDYDNTIEEKVSRINR